MSTNPTSDPQPSPASDASGGSPKWSKEEVAGTGAGPEHDPGRPDGDDGDDGQATGPEPAAEHDRTGAPVSDEEPPRLKFPVVGIGASAGGLEAFGDFFRAMPPDSGMAFVLVQHLPPDRESLMADILGKRTAMPVAQVEHGMMVEPNHVYVIRPGHQLAIRDGVLLLGPRLGDRVANRPIDDFFKSLAAEQRERAIAIVMSGMGSNGSAGAQAVKAVGGLCIAQDPDTAQYPSMPRHLIDQGYADYVLRPKDIPAALLRYAGHPYAAGAGRDRAAAAVGALAADQAAVDEVLVVLRVRLKQDYGGYKRATLLRRIQRRMGLNHVVRLDEYVRLLRQDPGEVRALADDLLIHVTGFFRDPEAWETLRLRVVEPLVAARENDASIRCWVTACSSGEEAYSLAILLAEAVEAAGKVMDVKVFATDMAERSLTHARAGVYPGGIEGEVTPERLERFFDKEDAVYRVKRALRDTVVFAPQNILQDPPFSKLDVATCRNLLIYLEPEVQRRVLSLVHFGLREGGTLFLGTSETIGGAEDLFEPVDKRWRIFRRVGGTRHGRADFPLPRAVAATAGQERLGLLRSAAAQRLTVPQLAQRALLERFTPAAVVVDRDHRIVYYHGDTEPFLAQPRGEPTRDLLALAREHVRGAIRTALLNAAAQDAPAAARDGTVETPGGRRRVTVVAAPLESKALPGFFLVSFQTHPEAVPTWAGHGAGGPDAGGDGDRGVLLDELQRVRDELQSTIEELQTSNEELKASNEEVTSINEELQSTNEELETSKEELQSLNEELTTVNAQLQIKMEEHEGASNDLQSLLSSTDIAVIFLDTKFRIRRFTPAVRDLMDVIQSDLGRPLKDLHRKFDDPDLLADAERVLAKLTPVERQVDGQGGRTFARRVLPYRTADNRIEGVVVTFIDVTERTRAERAVADARRYAEDIVESLPDPLLVLRSDLTVQTATAAFYDRFRVRPADTIGRKVYELGGGEWDIPALRKAMEDVLPADDAFDDYEVRHAFAGLGERVMVLNGRRLNRVQLILLGIRDVTDERGVVASRREGEAREAAIFAQAAVGLSEVSADGRFLRANDALCGTLGRPAGAVVGMLVLDVTHPDDRAATAAELGRALTTGERRTVEKRCLRPDGSVVQASHAVSRIDGENGRPPTLLVVTTDLTDRRRIEQAARESEERFREVVEGAGDFAIFLMDHAGVITTWNHAAERIFGYPEAEAVGRPAGMLFTPEDRAAGVPEAEAATAARRGRAKDERWHLRKDGTQFWANGSMSALRDPDGTVRGFVKILRDETARKRDDEDRGELLAREQAARLEAEHATRLKDEFLATLSHELRTPLSAVLIWAKMLKTPGVAPEQLAEGLDAIRVSAEAQRELIDDLLDTSRITAGKLRLEARDVPLTPVVRSAIDAILPTAHAKHVAVGSDFGADLGVVRADPERLRQIVWNLLSNAVKFTPAGGRVTVGLWRRGGEVEIRVADTGQGIDPEFLPHVFAPFRQADASTTRTHGGLGLGLAIVKQLVELHGGSVVADSEGPGKGATFTVRLPMPALADVAATTAGGVAAAGTAAAAGSPPLAGVRSLLVEDDPETRKALQVLLERAGAVVTAAGSTGAALEAFKPGRFDLVVSDIGLPDEDGFSLIRQVRQLEKGRRVKPVPAIALTAMTRTADRQTAIRAGFHQHLAKPVDPEMLVAVLTAVLARR